MSVTDASDHAMLFGADETPGLTGLHPTAGGMALYFRRDGLLTREERAYQPWLLTSHPHLLDGLKPAPRITELSGENYYKHRVEFDGWAEAKAAEQELRRAYRKEKDAYEYEPVLSQGDAVTQFLLAGGLTCFKGLAIDGPRVLFLALRAYNTGGAEYADPQAEGDRIVLLGLCDSHGGTEVLDIGAGTEHELLALLKERVLALDPDIIAAHDLFKGLLPYIGARIKRLALGKHKLLAWGRDGSDLSVRASRAPAAEKTLEYPRADCAGRSFVDSWFLTQYYDIVKRDLLRFDAPYVAGYLRPDQPQPDPLPAWDVDSAYDSDRPALEADVRGELAAVRTVYEMLIPSYFAQAQMLPLSLQDCVVRGNAVKINHLLMREYLRRGASIPEPASTYTTVGGLTELRRTGLIPDVLNADIASLYPSIMLKDGVKPRQDTGDVYVPMLRQLTARRLEAKKEARSAPDAHTRVLADARQAAFKIFINSFFGYLGTDRMNWADAEQAGYITRNGQLLVMQLSAGVEAEGGSIIEIDTDGVYFTHPDCATEAAREALIQRVSAHLPEGINVELGGFFPMMLSHRVKNYALLGEDGAAIIKGSGMKSRGLEPFLYYFIQRSIVSILHARPAEIEADYSALRARIAAREMPIGELAKTDTLIETLEQYKSKTSGGGRNKAAAYEVALQARRTMRAGDQVSYYITGDKATVKAFEAARPIREFDPAAPDYNVKYYLKKLDENLKKVKSYMDGGADGAAEAEQ